MGWCGASHGDGAAATQTTLVRATPQRTLGHEPAHGVSAGVLTSSWVFLTRVRLNNEKLRCVTTPNHQTALSSSPAKILLEPCPKKKTYKTQKITCMFIDFFFSVALAAVLCEEKYWGDREGIGTKKYTAVVGKSHLCTRHRRIIHGQTHPDGNMTPVNLPH